MSHSSSEQGGQAPKMPGLPEIEIREKGGKKDGVHQYMDRRLFMQLLVFTTDDAAASEARKEALIAAAKEAELACVIYEDANDPWSFALLTWSEDPAHFVTTVRPIFQRGGLGDLRLRRDYTMIGRTYSSGHERDLPYWLLQRPIDNVLAEDAVWAVWYPLRRSGAFSQLDRKEQAGILREHAAIGMAYGQKDLAHDVRLACHGLDAEDNEFLIGLLGRNLHPLSHVVQRMRSTVQTSQYITKMGPFFTGYAVYKSRGSSDNQTKKTEENSKKAE